MHLELTDEERQTLANILESYLSDLRMEIVDTDSMTYKLKLRDQKRVVTDMLEKLWQSAGEQPEVVQP